ncbi:MAG: menaquinone biosynthesis decarboxylase [Bacteroidia bacterium]|nr:menaquinone biosynthesis decarboxylase [Bacteroidia bacterium]
MAYKNLTAFIDRLEAEGELLRVREFVDPVLEITEVVDRISKAGEGRNKALLFENTGTGFPLLINSMGSERRMALALGVESLDSIAREIEALFKLLTAPKESIADKLKMLPKLGQFASWMPKRVSGKGACQEVVWKGDEVDLGKLPIMQCWPADGGRYITLPVIHTRDPLTGSRNVGMYRVQVLGKNETAIHWQLHKVSRRHFEEYRKLGQRMPVAIVVGGDPAYTYAATAPLPDGIDEYILAGFLRKKKVELVKCLTVDMEVPADADFVLEGYVDPNEDFVLEGPFGDHTGYYSLPDYYPRFHITAITHRKQAVYPSTIVGIPPQEDAWIGKATERIFLAPIKMTMVPEIVDMDLPVEGVFHNMAIVQIHKEFPGQGLKVMNSLWGAGQMMFTKMMLIVDAQANLKNYRDLARYVSRHFDPAQDLVLGQGPIDVLDHSCSKMAFGGKLGIDGTQKQDAEYLVGPPAWIDPTTIRLDLAQLQAAHPEVRALNTDLLADGISLVIVGIEKTRKGQVKALARALCAREEFAGVKVLLFLDAIMDLRHVGDAVWRFCNNTDVKRDSLVVEATHPAEVSHLCLDGTRKTAELDGFQRDWPNILVSRPDTIAAVDAKWPALSLGALIDSPSRKYQAGVYGEGAVADPVPVVLAAV